MDFSQGSWNVVWQQGDTLLKDHISRIAGFANLHSQEGDDFLGFCVWELLRDGRCVVWRGLEQALDNLALGAAGEQWLDTTVDGLKVALRLPDDAPAALQIWWKPPTPQEAERAAARQRAVEHLSGWAAAQEAACASNGQPASSATYPETLRRVIQVEQGRRGRVQTARDQVAALRQSCCATRSPGAGSPWSENAGSSPWRYQPTG